MSSEIKRELSLRPCSSISTLTLESVDLASPGLVDFISEISSPHIRRLVFPFTMRNPAALPDFTPLAALLSSSNNLAGLEDVLFIYKGNAEESAVSGKMNKELPEAVGRGLVRLVCVRT